MIIRKRTAGIVLLLLSASLSCTKSHENPPEKIARTIRYVLYTNKDFSSDEGIITFSLSMKNHNRVLLDSPLAPMKIKDIPHAAEKLVIEKTVPDNDPSDLTVGFLYTIENVGYSWHLDTCSAGSAFKIVEYAFE